MNIFSKISEILVSQILVQLSCVLYMIYLIMHAIKMNFVLFYDAAEIF